MFITEVTVKKDQIRYIEKKLNATKVVVALNIVLTILAAAHILYCAFNKVVDYNPYLMSGFSLVASVLYIVISIFEYRRFFRVYTEINTKGETILNTNFNVNLRRKTNGNTVLNWVCFGIVMACVLVIAVVQCISFNPVELSNLILSLVLAAMLLNQSINTTIYDKLYHECIVGKKK